MSVKHCIINIKSVKLSSWLICQIRKCGIINKLYVHEAFCACQTLERERIMCLSCSKRDVKTTIRTTDQSIKLKSTELTNKTRYSEFFLIPPHFVFIYTKTIIRSIVLLSIIRLFYKFVHIIKISVKLVIM